jgi:glyceraldehyde 3-phosphate dehydrogenase
VLPDLKGKIDGISIRVPTPNVSLVDLTFKSAKPVTVDSINKALADASETSLRGILAIEKDACVSVDFNGSEYSSIVDVANTMVVGKDFAKVFSWYDNEMGFSARMIDVAKHLAEKGL